MQKNFLNLGVLVAKVHFSQLPLEEQEKSLQSGQFSHLDQKEKDALKEGISNERTKQEVDIILS